MPKTSMSTYPDFVHDEQQHYIGEEHNDNPGNLWSYVEFIPGSYKKGIVVVDMKSADLISASGIGTLTAASPIGSTRLTDQGEFVNKDLRGAIGYIHEGPGIGQSFFVLSNDDNTLEIKLLRHGGTGWDVALTTASKYRLTMPGRVKVGQSGANNKVRGVVVYDTFSFSSGFKYGFVRKTGIEEGLIVASTGSDLPENGLVKSNNAGNILKGGVLADKIGTALIETEASTEEKLAPIEFLIENNRRSMRRPRKREDPVITAA